MVSQASFESDGRLLVCMSFKIEEGSNCVLHMSGSNMFISELSLFSNRDNASATTFCFPDLYTTSNEKS